MLRRHFLASAGASLAAALATETGRAEATGADDLAKRARALHQRSTVVVLHDHRPIAPDIPLMLAGGVTAKVYQIAVDVDPTADFRRTGAEREGWSRRAQAALDDALRQIDADRDHALLARTADDILRAKREGKVAILLGVEGAKLLEGRLDRLEHFHKLGLRELQLRWAVPNQLVERDSLTDFGRDVVKECHRLGIIVDLTHIPERAFFEAIDLCDKPPIVSHGTAAELGDRRVRAIQARGGVIGIHFFSSYLGPKPTVARALDAIDDLVRRAGHQTAALGVDFFPTTGGWRDFLIAQGTTDVSWAIPDTSAMPQITRGLVARNYSDAHIEAILGGNFLRLCRQVFGH